MPLSRRARTRLALFSAICVVAVVTGAAAGTRAGRDAATYRQLEIFTRVLTYIENNYVEEISEQKLIAGAIKGMVATLDPHTVYMPPEVFKEIKVDTSGEFGGLGIEVTRKTVVRGGVKTEAMVVVAPIDETPAARAGIRSGDVVLKIDGESTADLDLVAAISRMRGPAGSKVVLTIMREGFAEPRDIVLVRDRILIVSVDGRLRDGYGYVRIKNFQENTDRYLKRALDDLRAENKGELQGLVLDLRNNPGGLLEQAARVSDRFLKGGLTIVTTKGRAGRYVEEEKSHERDTEPNYPMIVLVNAGSASASEIVAGALQDHGRAVIMGASTFGKGSVQTLIELDDGSGLKLTIARYFTPKGRNIQEKGIAPDVEVLDPNERAEGTREVDLKNHLRADGTGAGTGSGRPSQPQDGAARGGGAEVAVGKDGKPLDPVLETALDYLRTWKVIKGNSPPKKASLSP